MALGINSAMGMINGALGIRLDPYTTYNFLVQIDGVIVAGFTDVSGMELSMESVEEVKEGGVNNYVHLLPTRVKSSDLVLKKGIGDIDILWEWVEKALIRGKVEKKDGSIFILDHQGLPCVWWDFYNAFPKKWSGPTLDASKTSVAIQSLTLGCERLEKSIAAKIVQAAGVARNFL